MEQNECNDVNAGNQGENVGNQGGNAGNQSGNAGNQGGDEGNQGGNAGNQGENAGNRGGYAGNQGGNAGIQLLHRYFTRILIDILEIKEKLISNTTSQQLLPRVAIASFFVNSNNVSQIFHLPNFNNISQKFFSDHRSIAIFISI